MKACKTNYLLILPALFLIVSSCQTQSKKRVFEFENHPELKLGFSSQNFLNALPLNVTGLTEVIEYASSEGFDFVEIRDQFVDLSIEDCKSLADVAEKNNIEVIYVFNKNPLDPEFPAFFEKALANVVVFKGPGILRAFASKTEFDSDPEKKGWTKDEFSRLLRISDSCAMVCRTNNIRFVFENSNEAFFGNDSTYFGLADVLYAGNTGLQLDIANPFRNTTRTKADPEEILNYLSSLKGKWVETHLKTVINGEPEPVLTDNNPIPVEKIIDRMKNLNVNYAALELTAVEDKTQCIENHRISIQYLKDKGLLK